jgi:hypothetical protein
VKCVALFLQRLDRSISLPCGFLIFYSSFHILGALVGSISFVELCMVEVLHEDLGMIFSLPMLVDLQVAFMMLSLYYAQHPCYLLHIMFPSPGIL